MIRSPTVQGKRGVAGTDESHCHPLRKDIPVMPEPISAPGKDGPQPGGTATHPAGVVEGMALCSQERRTHRSSSFADGALCGGRTRREYASAGRVGIMPRSTTRTKMF